jgi:hypothetical protein
MTNEPRPQPHPESERVERVQGAVIVFTPCHGRRVYFPAKEAVPGELLRAVCPHDAKEWQLRLVADETVDSGLRPDWVIPEQQAGDYER